MFAESLAKFVSKLSGRMPKRRWNTDLIMAMQNVPIKLTALINDTTGTLIASNYVDPDTKIAVIFGTGCNAAYMETAGNIPKMKHLGLPDDQEMAINVSLRR
jgi:hexokinase